MRLPRTVSIILLGVVVAGCAGPAKRRADAPTANAPALSGAEVIGQIRCGLYLPDEHLYGEEIGPGRGRAHPAYTWPSSVMVSALAAAARVEPGTYQLMLREYVDALRAYRTQRNGITGMDVLPAPKPPDRYYDDNAWMALALAETFQVTREAGDLQYADECLRFALSGEDGKLGGGIYWHEDRFDKKHTVSSAPAACTALELYRATGKGEYLDIGRRLYAWTAAHLQDSDGLYADSIAVADGKVDQSKYAYNSGLMIRAACLLYAITHDAHYMLDAHKTARAAEARWVRPADGAIRDEAPLAYKLCEAFLFLYDEDHDVHWLSVCGRAIGYVHDHCRDPNGWYAKRWDAQDVAALDPIQLIHQASAARAYWMAVAHGVPVSSP